MHDTTIGGAPPPNWAGTLQDWFDQRYAMETHNPRHADKRPKFVTDPAGSTRKVMLVHLESSDAPSAGIAQRSEISVRKEYTPPGQERWYSLSFYLDHYWPLYDKKTKFVLAQLHTSQRTVALSPPLEISAIGDRLTLTLRHNTRAVPGVAGAEGDLYASKSNSAQVFVKLGTLQRKRWYGFVINAAWSHKAHVGHLKVWMNGEMVHEQHNQPNTYENLDPTLGMYPKIGIYAPAGFNADVWNGKSAWVKSYVDWICLADPGGIGPVEMCARTPLTGVVPEATFPKS